METFEEMLNLKEDIDPELTPYILQGGPLGPMLKHPLVFDISYSEQMHAYYNRSLRVKKEYVEEKLKAGNLAGAIWMYERPYRFQMFLEYSIQMSNKQYWEVLADIWTDTENLWQYKSFITYLLTARQGPRQMMDEDSRALFKSLPKEVAIYRGYQTRNRQGFAWSLSPAKALWFARRFSPPRYNVVRGVIPRSDIVAVLAGRGEYEVVAYPSYVKKQQIVQPLARPEHLQRLLRETTAAFVLPMRHSHHGPEHWERVERNAIALCAANEKADLEICRLFAICHDCKRENEDKDPEHGHRAADWIKDHLNLVPVRGDRLEKLLEACRYHNDGQVSKDPTIGTCWDADRLDLPHEIENE